MTNDDRPILKTMAMRHFSVWNSLFGWSSIVLAGAIYAVLTLAPRIVLWESLSRERDASRERLEQLHARTQELESLVGALESDPRLVEEIARSEWRIEPVSEEAIAVDSSLAASFSQAARQSDIQPARPAAYVGWLRAISVDESLRGKLMLAAIALCFLPILSAPRQGSGNPQSAHAPAESGK
jgi:cell division protein FtsB